MGLRKVGKTYLYKKWIEIGEKKWNMILEMLLFTYYNLEINKNTEEVKIMSRKM